MKQKKAQVQLTFNWVYIILAGAIILLFFAGLVVQQKSSSEKNLQTEVVNIMESILVGAGVSEKTKNYIDISGLSDYVLDFKCDSSGTSFGIKNSGTSIQLVLDPVFSPQEINSPTLLLWSLPYYHPYKIMDLLMVSSSNTKYYVLGDNSFKTELEKAVRWEKGEKASFNFEFISDVNKIVAGSNYQVRLLDLTGNNIIAGNSVPSSLSNLDDSKVTGLSFSGGLTYFQKKNGKWNQLNTQPLPLISSSGDMDSAKYAAIFSADGDSYTCNMMKVFKRMSYVNKVYAGKLKELITYYSNPTNTGSSTCILMLKSGQNNLDNNLKLLDGAVNSCVLNQNYDSCRSITTYAAKINQLNLELQEKGCITLY